LIDYKNQTFSGEGLCWKGELRPSATPLVPSHFTTWIRLCQLLHIMEWCERRSSSHCCRPSYYENETRASEWRMQL